MVLVMSGVRCGRIETMRVLIVLLLRCDGRDAGEGLRR